MTRPDDIESGFPHGDWLDELVARSLSEDVGSGDVSTAVAVARGALAAGVMTARAEGVVAGLPLAAAVYRQLDPAVVFERICRDGHEVCRGEVLARLSGPAASLLAGERTALNFVQHLSGIATLTARYVAATAGTGCTVLDTRKTLPGYRSLAKYAVRCGGGANHRMGLFDRVMLKDNHWAAGHSVADMVATARRDFPHLAVEVEVDSLAQFGVVLPLSVDWILLDNFDPAGVAKAVRLRDAAGTATRLEASGNVTLESIGAMARTGVDAVSVGRLTHSAPSLDIGLDLEIS